MTDTTISHLATVFPVNAEALKPEPRFHRRRSIIREFALNTSTNGIPGIAKSESIHNRIFWTLSFLVFTGIMMYFLVENVIAYFGYPTQTSVSFVVARSESFPAVTICNTSPVRFNVFIEPFLNYTNSLNLTNTNDTSTITQIQATYINDFLQVIVNSNTSGRELFFPLESMLLYCSYNGETCEATDFISFYSSAYGLCYTFNAQLKSNQTNIRQTTDNGGSGKLQLRLYAQSQDYVPYLAEDVSAGMIIMIHDNTELPLIEVGGILLAPGLRHKLGYQVTTSQLLPSPYSDCTETIPLAMQAIFDGYEGADYAYSQVLCNTICIQTYLYVECNCSNPNEWTALYIVLPGTEQVIHAPVCNDSDTCYINAINRITNTDSIWNQYCSGCLQECSTVDFTITTSAVAAPSIQYAQIYKGVVENSGIPLAANWSETWLTEMQNNYVAVDVVCITTAVETYTESASINFVDLISNVGGQTGLWIGISFLSLMELVEMLYRLMRFQWFVARRNVGKKIRKRKQGTNMQQRQRVIDSIFP